MNRSIDIITEVGETMEHLPAAHDTDSPQLTLLLVKDETSFSALHKEWNELVLASSATIYQTHEWLSLWWTYFGKRPKRSLYCMILKHDNVLVGIIPWYQEQISVLGISVHHRLGMMGEGTAYNTSLGMFFDNGPSDYLDVIIRPGYESYVARTVTQHIVDRAAAVDTIDFVNAPPESAILSAIVPALQARGFSCKVTQADVCPYLSLPSSLEEYLHNISSSVRRRLSQAKRAGGEEGMYTIHEATTITEHKHALENIITLHQQRWNRMGYPGLFADKCFRDFQYAVLQAFHQQGWLWSKTAKTHETCVASRLAFKLNGRLYDYLSGFDDASPAAKRRPGLALLLAMIEDGINTSCTTVDFLRGDEQYKFELTPSSRYNWNVTLVSSTSPRNNRMSAQRLFLMIRLWFFLSRREWSLLGVQFRQHGFPLAVIRYIQFRVPRFTAKMKHLRSEK